MPFELIPFKVSKSKDSRPPKEPNHIFSDPDKSQYEIEFPLVEGYYSPQVFDLQIAWDQVSQLTVDPKEIPNSVELNSMTAPEGSLAFYGPGERPVLTLAEWRKQFRLQQVAFRLARAVCKRWESEQNRDQESDVTTSTATLFPKVNFAAKRFLQEKVNCIGNADPRDVLLAGKYHQQAVDILFETIRKGGIARTRELPRIAKGSAGRGSTRFVDYHTTKEVYPVNRCHLNAMVADTKRWEQSAGYALDTHPGVVRWVKNEQLGFFMPYRKQGIPARYIPDFMAVLDIVKDPTLLPRLLDENALAKWDQKAGVGVKSAIEQRSDGRKKPRSP